MIQAIPASLFFVVPVFSVFLLYVRFSSSAESNRLEDQCGCGNDTTARSFLQLSSFAVFSFVALSIMGGSLGCAAVALESRGLHQPGLGVAQRVVIVLIHLNLILSVIYVLATTIPSSIISRSKVALYNVALGLLLICATLLNMLSLFLVVPPPIPLVVPSVLTLLMTLIPFPLIAISLRKESIRLNSKSARFWIVFGSVEVAAVLSATFSILVAVVQNDSRLGFAFFLVESVLLVLWIVGMMSVLHLLPQRHSKPTRTPLHPHLSESPPPFHSHSLSSRSTPSTADTSDFLHLRDPFASPLPQPQSPTIREKGYLSYFGPHGTNMFKSKPKSASAKKLKAKRKASVRGFIGSPQFIGDHQQQHYPYEMTMINTLLFPANYSMSLGAGSGMMALSLEDVDFIKSEEALLAQLLLRNLDYDPEFDAEKRSSAIVGLGLGLGDDLVEYELKRDRKIIVTCERRGSESTVDSSASTNCMLLNGMPIQPTRLRLESTSTYCTTVGTTGSNITLCEPLSSQDKTCWEPPGPSTSEPIPEKRDMYFQDDSLGALGYGPDEKPLPMVPELLEVDREDLSVDQVTSESPP